MASRTEVDKSVDGFALAAERRRAGVNAYELAAELNVDPAQVSYYENGHVERMVRGLGESEYRDALRVVAERVGRRKRLRKEA